MIRLQIKKILLQGQMIASQTILIVLTFISPIKLDK